MIHASQESEGAIAFQDFTSFFPAVPLAFVAATVEFTQVYWTCVVSHA